MRVIEIKSHPLVESKAYWWRKGKIICVQNVIAGFPGQYHEHSEEEFKEWKQKSEELDWEVIERN